MTAISVRLPEELEAQLTHEAAIEGKARSEVAREAIAEYLARREQERFMAGMVAAAKALATDSAAMAEALELANDSADKGLDAIIKAECAADIDHNQKWWK